MRKQLSELQRQMAQSGAKMHASRLPVQFRSPLPQLPQNIRIDSAAIQDIRERQAIAGVPDRYPGAIKGGKRVAAIR